jgi:hypothetical protein
LHRLCGAGDLSATARLRKTKKKEDQTLFLPWADQSPMLELQWANTLLFGMSTVEVPNGSLLMLPAPPKDNPQDTLRFVVCHVPVRSPSCVSHLGAAAAEVALGGVNSQPH